MNLESSAAEQGLVAIPPLSDIPLSYVGHNRLAMDDDAGPWRADTERLVGKDEFASMRRELRAVVLARATATVPRWSTVVGRLERQAMAMPLWYLWFLVILAPLAMVGSATWMVAGTSIAKHLLGLAGLAVFGVTAMQAIYGMTHRPQGS